MRAVACSGPGGVEVLSVASAPIPVPGPGEALIRVAYAGVNGPDLLQVGGDASASGEGGGGGDGPAP
jgi:NADPH2:quinone reductase